MWFLPKGPKCQSINPKPILTARDYWLLALLTTGGLTLRLVGLDEGLWYDEIATLVGYVRLPVNEIILLTDHRNNHVFYSILAHLSSSWFGESAWSIRLPAALFGAATIPAAYYLGLQLANRREALLTAVFLLGSYHHVWFSQSARGYTGILFAAVVLSIIFIRLLSSRKPSWGAVAAYSVVAALGTWIHLTMAMIVIAHAIIWFGYSLKHWRNGEQKENWHTLIAIVSSGLLSIVFYAGMLAVLVKSYLAPIVSGASGEQIMFASFDGSWLFDELALALTQAVPAGGVVMPVLVLVLVLVTLAGFWSYARQGWLSWGVLVLPFMVILAAFLLLHAMFFPRFLLSCMVFLLLIGVRGGYVLLYFLVPSLTMKHTSAIGLGIAFALALMVPRAWQPKQDVVDAHHFLQTQVEQGDAIACDTTIQVILESYLGMKCKLVNSVSELISVEDTHTRTWYVSTLTLFGVEKNLLERLRNEYTLEKTASSTVNKGDILIFLN